MAQKTSAKIGVRDLHLFKLIDETQTAAEYGEPQRLADLIEIQVSPQTQSGELYADDSISEAVSFVSAYDITLNVKDLSPEMRADLLGYRKDENGLIYTSADLNAPTYAVAFRAERADGTFEYRQLFKVKFAPSDDTYKTKGDSIDFQTDTITGKSMVLTPTREFGVQVIGTEENKAITDKWFEEVQTGIEATGTASSEG